MLKSGAKGGRVWVNMNQNSQKNFLKQKRNSVMQDQLKVYNNFFELVEQVLHSRIVADAVWKYRWDRVAKTGEGNSIITFSQVALENFTIQQLWKLFDKKNSVFNVWYVAENLPYPKLLIWLNKNIKNVKLDLDLISEWRHIAVGHRSEVMHFISEQYQDKFKEGRLSEKRLQDFLFNFLSHMKFEIQHIPVEKTLEELRIAMDAFEHYIRSSIKEVYKEI